MRCGESITINSSNVGGVVDGVIKTLRAAHSVNVLHCDIRSPNEI